MTAPATKPGTLHTGPSTLTPPKTAPKLSFLMELAVPPREHSQLRTRRPPGITVSIQLRCSDANDLGVRLPAGWSLRKVLLAAQAPGHGHQCGVQQTLQHPGGSLKGRDPTWWACRVAKGPVPHIALWDRGGCVKLFFLTGARRVCTGAHVLPRVEPPCTLGSWWHLFRERTLGTLGAPCPGVTGSPNARGKLTTLDPRQRGVLGPEHGRICGSLLTRGADLQAGCTLGGADFACGCQRQRGPRGGGTDSLTTAQSEAGVRPLGGPGPLSPDSAATAVPEGHGETGCSTEPPHLSHPRPRG